MEEYESKQISKYLDKLGLSLDQVQRRRRLYLYHDFLINLPFTLSLDCSITRYTQGSMPEGVGLLALNSDLDVMICRHSARIIHHISDWEFRPDRRTFLADTSSVHPGYCHLKEMHIDEPTFTGILHSQRVNRDFHIRNGPAQTLHLENMAHAQIPSFKGLDMDHVQSYQTRWPPAANKWIRRRRSNNFPLQEFISSVEKQHIHVVQIGHKKSCNRDIEWRFSFSRLECDIIKLWPIKTLKCYVLLKHLKTEFNEQCPSLPHTLCSYHMKTLMLWLVEETGVQYWRERSLLACLTFCLTKLLQCVEQSWLPHYFISENNLFDMDIGDVHCLSRFLQDLVSDKHRLYEKCISIKKHISKGCAKRERAYINAQFCVAVYHFSDKIYKYVSSNNIETKFAKFQSVIDIFVSSTAHCDQELLPVLLYMADLLKSRYCTCILSTIRVTRMSNSTCFLLSRIAEQILRLSVHEGKYVLVQMANFWYQTGRYRRATEILEKALYVQPLRDDQESMQAVLDELQNYPFHTCLKSEIHATPYALQLAMYKTNKAPRNHTEQCQSDRAQEAEVNVDSLICYLQYLCYTQMEKHRHAQAAVDNLEWISKDPRNDHNNKEITLNLLGDCYLRRGDLRRATSCFVQSVRVEPKYTSALLHLAITIGKANSRQ